MSIAIIGAGPAGIFSTLLLKDFPEEIHLFEQNKKLGEKLRLTGGGRMNITNRCFSADQFTSSHPQLLKNLFKSPWVAKREEIFEMLGIKYKWEQDRAILASENAFKEVDRLTEAVQNQKNVQLHVGTRVLGIKKMDKGFLLSFRYADQDITEMFFDAVILASGGMFRLKDSAKNPEEIYKIPLQLGHSFIPPSPSLSPLLIHSHPLATLAGTAFQGVLRQGKNHISGDVLITHQGLSGPAVLDFSAWVSGNEAELSFITTDENMFAEQFQKLKQGKYFLRGFLRSFLPQKLADWHLEKLNLNYEAVIADIKKEVFLELKKQLFHFPLKNISTMDYSFCWTTKGGIPLNEINVATMESKICSKLFFAGEMLDVNGLCGGYNISFAGISTKIIAEYLGNNEV